MHDDLFSMENFSDAKCFFITVRSPSQQLLTQWLKMEYFSDRYSRHKSLAMPLRRRCCTPQTASHDLFLRFMISGMDRPKPKHSVGLLRVATISIHTNCTLQFWWPLLSISVPARLLVLSGFFPGQGCMTWMECYHQDFVFSLRPSLARKQVEYDVCRQDYDGEKVMGHNK